MASKIGLLPFPSITKKKGEEGYDEEMKKRKEIADENTKRVKQMIKRMECIKGSILWKGTEKEKMEWREELKRRREKKERQIQEANRYKIRYTRRKKIENKCCSCCCNDKNKN